MYLSKLLVLHWIFVTCSIVKYGSAGNPDAKRLFEDLLSDYNKMVRPVESNNQTLVVKFKLKLSQLLDVHEKNQIMTTNVWLEHIWEDYKLTWNPAEYGGVQVLYVPSEMIWLPDIVLYNNADGNYQVTIMTKAKVYHDGKVIWNPPAIYKSMCQIDVEWFPFDAQKCEMKFGSWTYGGLEVDIKHKDSDLVVCVWDQHKDVSNEDEFTKAFKNQSLHEEFCKDEKRPNVNGEWTWHVERGIDLGEYYPSVEWDILSVPGVRHRKVYPCCPAPFIDITYVLNLAPENPLLHRQPHISFRWYIFPNRARILPTQRFWRKNFALHFYFDFLNCVLLAPGRNYSVN